MSKDEEQPKTKLSGGKVVRMNPESNTITPEVIQETIPRLMRYFEVAWDNPGPIATVETYDQMHTLVDKLLLSSVSQIVIRAITQVSPEISGPLEETETPQV